MRDKGAIGIFGGTFDPIHRTHVDIARAALRQAHLRRILFVVAARPPHKDSVDLTSAEDRLAMVEAALEDEPDMEASRIEIDMEGPSYTAHTLTKLALAYPGYRLALILGMDSLVELPSWYAPEEILRNATLVVVPRAGEAPEIPARLEGHYQLLDFEPTSDSSTEVRRRIEAGESLHALLPDATADYIQKRGLYGIHL